MNLIKLDPEDPHYLAIKEFYGDRKANRSGVPLINHIHEGLAIMDELDYTLDAQRAYCLHPLFQPDADLAKADWPRFDEFSRWVILLAMEYRNFANAYLSTRVIGHTDEIALSPLFEVTQMLVADKLQNYKDFMKYHYMTHPRSSELHKYFWNWFNRLGLEEHGLLKLPYRKYVQGGFTA